MLTQTLSPGEAQEIYRDTGLLQEHRTLAWNIVLAERAGMRVLEAYLHSSGERWWGEFYEPLLNEDGPSKRPERQSEINVWGAMRDAITALGSCRRRAKRECSAYKPMGGEGLRV